MWNTTNDSTHDVALAPGQMLGRYELLSPIAAGGMGNVWAARLKGTRGFRKLVAIKTILQSFEDQKLEQMLFQEATLASQIHHPNVVETLELGEHQGVLYLVMELIHGESLTFVMRESIKHGGVPLNVGVNLIGQVCRGLQAAHDLCDDDGTRVGLVHRDISPPNILVTYSGTVKIVDFGVATTSSSTTLGSGEIKGKISYLAPEQLRGDPVDGRVDVFAAGVVLYLLTVGRHPFKAPSEAQTIARILGETRPTPPSSWVPGYPEALEHVVLRALEKNPADRFASANEFLSALSRAMPEAFGPNAEKAAAEWIGDLLRPRMQQRQATLRIAEECTERSSRPSASSLPVMMSAAPRASAKVPSRIAFALAGMLLVLGATAALRRLPELQTIFRGPAVAEREVAKARGGPVVVSTASARDATDVVARAAPVSASPISPSPTAVRAAAVAAPAAESAARAAPRPRSTPASSSTRSGEKDPVALIDSGLAGLEADAVPNPPEGNGDAHAVQALDSLASSAPAPAPSPAFVAAVLVPKAPPATKPAAPKMVASKVAHERLLTNPRSDAHRVKVPAALANVRQSFAATVRICVSPDGSVSSVSVLRPSGSVMDAQIPGVLGSWRYQPLLEGGTRIPFCYVMRYELGTP